MDPSYSFVFFIVFNLLKLGEFLFFSDMLNARFLRRVSEGRASRHHVSTFATTEAESLLGALFSFLWSKFLGEFDHINIHGIGVFGCFRRQRKGLESLGGPSASLSDLLSTIPLVLEVGGF